MNKCLCLFLHDRFVNNSWWLYVMNRLCGHSWFLAWNKIYIILVQSCV